MRTVRHETCDFLGPDSSDCGWKFISRQTFSFLADDIREPWSALRIERSDRRRGWSNVIARRLSDPLWSTVLVDLRVRCIDADHVRDGEQVEDAGERSQDRRSEHVLVFGGKR